MRPGQVDPVPGFDYRSAGQRPQTHGHQSVRMELVVTIVNADQEVESRYIRLQATKVPAWPRDPRAME